MESLMDVSTTCVELRNLSIEVVVGDGLVLMPGATMVGLCSATLRFN